MATQVQASEGLEPIDAVGPGDDRRAASRFTILIRAAKLIDGEQDYLCVIRDVSTKGVKLRLYNNIPTERPFTLELANGERFAVEQVWARDGFAGFRFPDPVELERLIEVERGPYPSRKLRLRTRITGQLFAGGDGHGVQVANISQQGAAVICDAFLALDQLVRLDCPGLPSLYAKVRWRRRPDYGLVFEQTLAFEQLVKLSG
ncbi:MAG TPA: PilZ domain-containing protein [Novosphingobium sp.]|nr:PilZ domain-containing protein [Novosphingobium sp.]HMP57437.1 PilZ domain-containing protein [Novosphingobium sp.]